MIEVVIYPDGAAELPAEARDHGILASHLSAANADIEGNNSVVIDWREVEREVHRERMVLRAPGAMSDYQQAALDAITGAVVNNVNGLKQHPDGWTEVQQ